MKKLLLFPAALLVLALPVAAAPILSPSTTTYGGVVDATNFVTGAEGTSAGTNNWPGSEAPAEVTDGLIGGSSKYLNFAVTNTAVLFAGSTARVAERMQLWVANDAVERDPASYQLYGTNSPISALSPGFIVPLNAFTLLGSGPLALPAGRDGADDVTGFSQMVPLPNTTAYASYLLVFPTVKGPSANSMQISEVQLYDRGIIGVEQFDYPDGTVIGKTGGTFWNYKNFSPTGPTGSPSTWDNVTAAPAVAAGRLVTQNSSARREYNGTLDSDGAVNDPASVPSSVAKSVYYRVTVTTGATLPDFFGISSMDFGTEQIFFGKRFGQAKFGMDEVGVGGISSTNTADVAPNTTYTLVAKLNYATDSLALWVNPALNAPEESQLPAATRTYTGTSWSTAVRLASGGGSPVLWDDLVVATSWDDLGTVVTTTEDHEDGSLDPFAGSSEGISLREAVKYSPAGSLITFDAESSGQTCTLTHPAGEMLIPGALTIDASALPGGFTVNGNNASRHFQVEPGKSLTLRGLTLTGGNAAGDGGAVYNAGTLHLDRCTLAGNASAFDGGAIGSAGSSTLTQCTLSGNRSGRDGGAILIGTGGSLTLTHCTLSSNLANRDGGAIESRGFVALANTIIAANFCYSLGPDVDSGFAITPTGVNFIGNLAFSGLTAGPGVLTGDAKLTPLGYFGGPVQTMHPLIGSPAIDAAGTTNPGGTDARGFPRFVDGDDSTVAQLDIGAVEAGPVYQFSSATDAGLRSLINLAGQPSQPPGIRIRFNIPGGSTITLGGTELSFAAGKMLFLDASNLSAPVTISGNNLSRVFNIPATATVAMHSVKIVNGKAASGAPGGGIFNGGTASLLASTVSGSRAGDGIDGGLPGGGIYNNGRMLIVSSTISGNRAGDGPDGGGSGGGIYNAASLIVSGSTISENRAGDSSSTFEGGTGGGISNVFADLVISASTISGNISGRNIEGTQSSGGGIFNHSSACMLHSSIVAGNNSAIAALDFEQSFGPAPVLAGVNFIGNLTGSGLTASATILTGNALLAPLGNYGGPTQTMPPLRGSPALDAAAVTTAQTDQRGFPRSRDGDGNGSALPDLGAAEAGLVFVTSTSNADPGSLRAALTEAAAQPGPDTVHFTAAVTSHIGLTSEIVITDPGGVTLDASDRPTGLVIDGGPGTNRHFRIEAGTTATFQRLRLYGGGGVGSGTPANYGGSLHNSGSLTLRECTFADNSSTNAAGAIYNQSGALTIERSTFHGNSSGSSGAILHESLTPLTITASTFTGNIGRFEGGAITLGGFRPATLTHCTIAGNAVTQTGGGGSGGIRAGNPANAASNLLTLRDSIIAENTDANTPGVPNVNPGFTNPAGSSNLVNLPANLAPLGDYGGPAWTMPPMPGSLAIDNATASTAATDQRGAPRPVDGDLDNTTARDIGAVEVPGPLTVNTAADQNDTPAGSLVSLREAIRDAAAGATVRFDPFVFDGQPADTITLGSQIIFPRGLIVNASANPGGVTIDGGPGTNRIFSLPAGTGASLHRLTLTGGGGTAEPNEAGVIRCDQATLALTDCTLTGNTVSHLGGAIINNYGTLTADRCLFASNTGGGGGAIYAITADLTGPAISSTTLTNCTLTNNISTGGGGGIYNDGGRATLLHCTITGNTAAVGNVSGVFSFGDALTRTTVQNCLIAGNSNASDVSGSLVSLGGNLIGSGSATGAFNQLRDATAHTAATLRLAPLADYGGPNHTMALRPGSPALGNATVSPVTTDQRGFGIVIGTKDSGAYEAGNAWLTSFNAFIYENLPHTATVPQTALAFDFDSDGTTNELEWLAVTGPANPASAFRLAVSTVPNNIVMTFPTVTGRTYWLQYSDTLAAESWITHPTSDIEGNGLPNSYTLPTASPARRFFRVMINP